MANVLARLAAFARATAAWRPFVLTTLTGLAAIVVWLIAQANSMADSIDRYAKMGRENRAELETYITEFRKDDVTKTDFLNRTLYRVKMHVITPEAGANMMCWFAAISFSRSEDAGSVVETTGQDVLNFLDANQNLFELQPRKQWPWQQTPVIAATASKFCEDYLPETVEAERGLEAAGFFKLDQALQAQAGQMVEAGRASAIPTDPAAPTGPAPAAIATSSDTESSGRLFVQIADEAQRAKARAVGAALGDRLAVDYQNVEYVRNFTGATQIRFYKNEDKALAEKAGQSLRCDGNATPSVRYVERYEHSPLVRPHTLELWIGPGSIGCSVFPAEPRQSSPR